MPFALLAGLMPQAENVQYVFPACYGTRQRILEPFNLLKGIRCQSGTQTQKQGAKVAPDSGDSKRIRPRMELS